MSIAPPWSSLATQASPLTQLKAKRIIEAIDRNRTRQLSLKYNSATQASEFVMS